jgi:hypothetical protein
MMPAVVIAVTLASPPGDVRSATVAALSPSPARDRVDRCEAQCPLGEQRRTPRLESERPGATIGGGIVRKEDADRICQRAHMRMSGARWCGLGVSTAGLTFFLFAPRTGRTHPVRATLSRRGVRVSVRF